MAGLNWEANRRNRLPREFRDEAWEPFVQRHDCAYEPEPAFVMRRRAHDSALAASRGNFRPAQAWLSSILGETFFIGGRGSFASMKDRIVPHVTALRRAPGGRHDDAKLKRLLAALTFIDLVYVEYASLRASSEQTS